MMKRKSEKREASHKSFVTRGKKYGKTTLKAPVLPQEGGYHLHKDSVVCFSFFVMHGKNILSTSQ